ncbi:MAG: TolC family protein, partial [Cytophagaceae bacterium]
MSRLTIAILLALSLVPTVAFSEEALTLDSVLSKVGGSPRLQRSNSVAEEASWKKTEGLSTLLPTLTLGASRLLDKKYLLTDISLGGAPVS